MDTIEISATNAALDDTRAKLGDLNSLAGSFGAAMTRAFSGGIAQGKSFDDILKGLGQKFIDLSLRAAFKPLQGVISSGIGALTQGLTGAFSGMFGGGAATGPVMPFADGGVIAAPTYFPLGRGAGLAGEAGPEAILPLRRGADGRLGVAAGGNAAATQVVVNIQTPDVEGFSRAESHVAASLARAVARGNRGL